LGVSYAGDGSALRGRSVVPERTLVARWIGDNEIAVIDTFVGGLTLLVSNISRRADPAVHLHHLGGNQIAMFLSRAMMSATLVA
jgi:hypothetical protein